MRHILPLSFPRREHWTQEHQFDPKRRWRFDFALIEAKVAVEIEGGVWTRGRHTRGSGFVKDMEKYNNAQAQGWKIFRFTPRQLQSGEASDFIGRLGLWNLPNLTR